MTTPQHNITPASPIPAHVPLIAGGAGALFGIAALVLLLCVITLDMPSAPMSFAAIAAGASAVVAFIGRTAERLVEHQQACFEANRNASEAEVAAALKKVHKEVEALKRQWQRAQVARVSEELFGSPATPAEQTTRLDVIEGGRNGMG